MPDNHALPSPIPNVLNQSMFISLERLSGSATLTPTTYWRLAALKAILSKHLTSRDRTSQKVTAYTWNLAENSARTAGSSEGKGPDERSGPCDWVGLLVPVELSVKLGFVAQVDFEI